MTTKIRDRFPLLILAAAVGVYALLLSGSYVTITGATTACVEWPLCQGELIPDQRLPVIHMAHRLLVAIVGLFVMYSLMLGSRKGRWPKYIRILQKHSIGQINASIEFDSVTLRVFQLGSSNGKPEHATNPENHS